MLDFDSRTSKFEKEQQKRREEARKKKEREEKLRLEQLQRDEQLAAIAAKRREEEEEQRILKEIAEQEEDRITGGIRFSMKLTPYIIASKAADNATEDEAKTEDDKVILPEDALTELTNQDAFSKHRVATFQLTIHNNKEAITHCGVREFSAPSGMIGLTEKIARSLHLIPSSINLDLVKVNIKYVLLEKCTYVKLKPKANSFFDVGPIKLCLENNLQYHTTLSVNDILTVWYRGNKYELVVSELKPEHKVNLIDTEVVVDIDNSEEYETQQKMEQVQQQQPPQPPQQQEQATNILSTSKGYKLGSSQTTNDTMDVVDNTATTQTILPDYFHTTTLIPESDITSNTAVNKSDIITVKVKLLTGKTLTRKFLKTMSLLQLVLFILQQDNDLQSNSNIDKVTMNTRFPVRSFTLMQIDHMTTFESVGITGNSENFFLSLQ